MLHGEVSSRSSLGDSGDGPRTKERGWVLGPGPSIDAWLVPRVGLKDLLLGIAFFPSLGVNKENEDMPCPS
jgi:hypothetical protein